MLSRDVRGLIGVGVTNVGVSHRILFRRSPRCLIAVEASEPESNSDCSGDGPLARACASASLFIKSNPRDVATFQSTLCYLVLEEHVDEAHLRRGLLTTGHPTMHPFGP